MSLSRTTEICDGTLFFLICLHIYYCGTTDNLQLQTQVTENYTSQAYPFQFQKSIVGFVSTETAVSMDLSLWSIIFRKVILNSTQSKIQLTNKYQNQKDFLLQICLDWSKRLKALRGLQFTLITHRNTHACTHTYTHARTRADACACSYKLTRTDVYVKTAHFEVLGVDLMKT